MFTNNGFLDKVGMGDRRGWVICIFWMDCGKLTIRGEVGFSQWLDEVYQSSPENMLGLIEPTLDKLMIDFALEKTNGKKQDAAKVLGLGRNTLTKKIQSQKD